MKLISLDIIYALAKFLAMTICWAMDLKNPSTMQVAKPYIGFTICYTVGNAVVNTVGNAVVNTVGYGFGYDIGYCIGYVIDNTIGYSCVMLLAI